MRSMAICLSDEQCTGFSTSLPCGEHTVTMCGHPLYPLVHLTQSVSLEPPHQGVFRVGSLTRIVGEGPDWYLSPTALSYALTPSPLLVNRSTETAAYLVTFQKPHARLSILIG